MRSCLVVLYGITYSFHKPAMAVPATYILLAITVAIQLIIGNNLIGSIRASEIIADDDPRVVEAYRTLYRLSALVFVSAVIVGVLALPAAFYRLAI